MEFWFGLLVTAVKHLYYCGGMTPITSIDNLSENDRKNQWVTMNLISQPNNRTVSDDYKEPTKELPCPFRLDFLIGVFENERWRPKVIAAQRFTEKLEQASSWLFRFLKQCQFPVFTTDISLLSWISNQMSYLVWAYLRLFERKQSVFLTHWYTGGQRR